MQGDALLKVCLVLIVILVIPVKLEAQEYQLKSPDNQLTLTINTENTVTFSVNYMNAEVIERDMTVEDGLITLPHGIQYKTGLESF